MTRRRVGLKHPWIAACCWVLLVAGGALAQDHGALFPQPFSVEHSIVQTDADGSVFTTEPVVDTYVGSRIVSERVDGSRMIIDFARREITDIRTNEARYTVIGFDRLADLLRELQVIESGGSPSPAKSARGDDLPSLRVVEADGPAATKSSVSSGALVKRAGVRHLRVLEQTDDNAAETTVLDVWFDPQLRLGERSLSALEEFELEVLSVTSKNATAARSLAAARHEAGGALPILTLRPVIAGSDEAGTIEDVSSRVERVNAVPPELVTIPDGFERVPHPLEMMVAHARSEAELNSRMSGSGGR
jgi:hypothetical protein